ncbi:ribonuclease HII [Taibaiella sp. KBW10]|uniref:ribonuclease HII n=1 Tax=Taibaiella sp. KBW10 TaxID=2153357 RepID=UPI000F5920DA|nr:ribonuclease HII [Taibaiella sp. KBW10]RQO32684.1 ribonuclease HII [Taibaiella sp. KBW10]
MLAASYTKELIEAGCDEAGRGCIAGPVVAAAVILPKDFYHPLLNDSKQLSERDRALLRPVVEQQALAFAVTFIDNEEIDVINILKASFKAMHQCVDKLLIKPELLLIDGNRFPAYLGIPHQCIVKGDSKYASIAAASILAKTYRDEYIEQLSESYPDYDWKTNKGYPTPAHKRITMSKGHTPFHRITFKIKPPKEKGTP